MKEITMKFLLDEATEKKLNEVCEEYNVAYNAEMESDDFFSFMMTAGSLLDINAKLDSFRQIIGNRKQG